MRLTGEIQVSNRLSTIHSFPNKRAEWSYLTIGYDERNEIFILHQTQKNASGTKYKIFGNLVAVFNRFINNGKITLRFKKPAHDLIIHSTEDQLKPFGEIIHSLMRAGFKERNIKLSDLSDVPRRVGPKPKTKLEVNNETDKPFDGAYPRTLEALKINNSGLTCLDARIFRLQVLKILNLENNRLEVLPTQLSLLPCIRELHLAANMLGRNPLDKWLLLDNFESGLVFLDLRRNDISSLPGDIYRLKRLKSLHLDDNLLVKLPNAFGRLPRLNDLRLSNNRLQALPASFRFLSLEKLDISCNPGWSPGSQAEDNLAQYDSSSISSLLDIAAKTVLNSRLEFERRSVPLGLMNYLDSASYCICGQATFPSSPERYISFDVKRICLLVSFTTCHFPVEIRFCSKRCRMAFCPICNRD